MGAIHKKARGTHPDISGGSPAPELTAQRLGVPRPISLDVGFLLDVRPHELLEGLGLETDCTDKGVLIRSHGALLAQDLLVVGTEHQAAAVGLVGRDAEQTHDIDPDPDRGVEVLAVDPVDTGVEDIEGVGPASGACGSRGWESVCG